MRKMTVSDDMTLIDRKCVERGITRTDLARMSGVPLRTLESWSRKLRIPSNVYQLYKVAQVLDCHIEDLIDPEMVEQAGKE